MKKPPYLTLSLILALAGFCTVRADTIHAGSYTVEITSAGGMTAATAGNAIGFSHERVDGVAPGTAPGSVTEIGSLTATFTADEGLIFDKLYFGGLAGGITAIEQGGASSRINWQVNGGTFSGPDTYGGSSSVGFAREWEITGANTGTSYFYGGLWFLTRIWDFNNPVYGSGYYDIGASSFSISLDSSVYVTDSGYWTSFIVPLSVGFNPTYLAAPPPSSSVPETGATAGLMLLGLAGLAGVRRMRGTGRDSVDTNSAAPVR